MRRSASPHRSESPSHPVPATRERSRVVANTAIVASAGLRSATRRAFALALVLPWLALGACSDDVELDADGNPTRSDASAPRPDGSTDATTRPGEDADVTEDASDPARDAASDATSNGDAADDASTDASDTDGGLSDAGVLDADVLDAGPTDASPLDASLTDAAAADAGTEDAAPADAGALDAAGDAALLDAGASTDAGDASTADAAVCPVERRRCVETFTYPDEGQSEVELRGDWGGVETWSRGVVMARANGQWRVTLDIPPGQSVQYRFCINRCPTGDLVVKNGDPTVQNGNFTNNIRANVSCAEFVCAP
jgi:hypothetical protein